MGNRVNILGVHVDKVNIPQAADMIYDFIGKGDGVQTVFTPNSEIIMKAYRNAQLCEILNSGTLLTADGIGVVYASVILSNPIAERCPGFDVATELLSRMSKTGKSLYLFGSRPKVAEKAAENILQKFPGIVISGCADGYFDSEKEKEIIKDINAKTPDVLFVCLGAPKQERWIYENKDKLSVSVCMGLGGSLDVFAGEVSRAPEFYQKHGIEWLYRLIKEPKRFVRMLDLPRFAITVLFKGRKFKQER